MYPNIEVKYKPHDQSDFVSNSSSRILYDVPCKVCGDFSSGKHYGIFACDGCAGFFKRSIRRGRDYPCKGRDTQCVIDKTHRNQCRGCRLRRCVEVGMNREAVQHERGPRNATIRKQMEDLSTAGYTFAPAQRFIHPYSTLPFPYLHFSPTDNHSSPSPPSSPSSITSSPSSCASITPPPTSILSKSEVCETAAKILFMTAQWVRSVPSFLLLSPKDQSMLYMQSWQKLFTLGCAQFLTVSDLEQFEYYQAVPKKEFYSFLRTVSFIRSLDLSPADYACLRAVLLFNSKESKACHARHSIAALSEQAMLAVAQSHPAMLPRLLRCVSEMEDILPATLHQIFFKDTIGDVDIGTLVAGLLLLDIKI